MKTKIDAFGEEFLSDTAQYVLEHSEFLDLSEFKGMTAAEIAEALEETRRLLTWEPSDVYEEEALYVTGEYEGYTKRDMLKIGEEIVRALEQIEKSHNELLDGKAITTDKINEAQWNIIEYSGTLLIKNLVGRSIKDIFEVLWDFYYYREHSFQLAGLDKSKPRYSYMYNDKLTKKDIAKLAKENAAVLNKSKNN